MKILAALTYYKPYISGLTIYAARVAEAWARAGHEVTVLTSRHSADQAPEEMLNGVRVVREPVFLKISKGAVMPKFWLDAAKYVKEADVINIHLPQLESALLARLGRKYGKKIVLTYHCDLQMPSGVINSLANKGVLWMNDLAFRSCDAVVTNSQDYADHSEILSKIKDKVHIIQPPVELDPISDEAAAAFRMKKNADRFSPIIGMACRFAADKGVEILLDALPKVLTAFPKAAVFFMGPYENVLGEAAYYERLKPRIDELIKAGHWQFMGRLPDAEVPAFYRCIDVLTMPSLNRTDSFGLVQIEAMINGKPVAASDLPGIRVPVQRHGMGEIFPVGDANALADALIRILHTKQVYSTEFCEEIKKMYSPDNVAAIYTDLFKNI
ncbi:MAG: glycosyltransferase family 4 protein [Anaerolineaceae bacterium]|nr:glycosyltransferase family 4 protein [Anaerolineaceae bacterium]